MKVFDSLTSSEKYYFLIHFWEREKLSSFDLFARFGDFFLIDSFALLEKYIYSDSLVYHE